MPSTQPPIGRRQFTDLMREMGRLLPPLVRENLNDRVLARQQQPAPIRRNLAPDLVARPLQHERALGAMALDQMLVFENAKRLANGGAGDAAFGGKIVHGGYLRARCPKPGLDAPPK